MSCQVSAVDEAGENFYNEEEKGDHGCLMQMALAWVLRRTTSVIIGASRLTQIQENMAVLSKLDFTAEELDRIESIRSEK